MKRVFLATVQIAFEADNESEACDVVSAIFTENLRQDNVIIDWQYAPYNSQFPPPVDIGLHNVKELEEGEIFNRDYTKQT